MYTKPQRSYPVKEVVDQIEVTRKQAGSPGVVHFSMKCFMRNAAGISDEVAKAYAEPAIVPETPWLSGDVRPAKPDVTRETIKGRDLVRIHTGASNRFVVVRGMSADGQSVIVRGFDAEGRVTLPLPKAAR